MYNFSIPWGSEKNFLHCGQGLKVASLNAWDMFQLCGTYDL